MRINREYYLENEKTMDNSGSFPIDLSVVDPISEIQIRFKAKNGATYNKNSPVARCISAIELVDGSDVLYSLSGMLSQSMSYYQTRKLPSMQRQSGPSENQEDHFILRFGRSLWDKLYALNPKEFRNPQLKITWDLATVNNVGATGFLDASARLSVIVRIMEGLEGSPKGFLMAKNHYNFTTAGSGDERVVLPIDHPYVLLLFRAWESNTKLFSSISNLKLSLNQDKNIPFNLTSWDFLKMMENEYGKFILDQRPFGGNEDGVQTWVAVGETIGAVPEPTVAASGAFSTHVNVLDVDSGRVNLRAVGTDHSTTSPTIHHIMTLGQGLHHTLAYPFGSLDDEASWLQMTDIKDIKLIVSQGNPGAAASAVLLQARTY